MENIFMNANSEDVVQPQEVQEINQEVASPEDETQKENREFVSPEDMSDEEFKEYINGLKDGTDLPENKPLSQEVDSVIENKTEEAKVAFKTFETEEDFQGFMNKAIGDRLKTSRAEKERYEEYGRRAMNFYGGESYEEALGKMLDDVENQFAESSGKTREEFAEDMRIKMDAMSYRRQIAEEEARENAIAKIQEGWAKEEEALKRAVPGFELSRAMEIPEFKNLVINEGMSLSSAYITLTNKQVKTAERPVISEVGNARGKTAGVGAKRPEEMSSEEFKAYIERIKEKG